VKSACAFFCPIDNLLTLDNTDNKFYTLEILYGTELKIWKIRDLNASIKDYYKKALVDIRLGDFKLDWSLHGWKRLTSNFISALYESWDAKLNNPKKKEELNNFEVQMRAHVRKNFMVPATKGDSIKFSGNEATSFTNNYVPIIQSLDPNDVTTIEVFESLHKFYVMLMQPKRLKLNLGVYAYMRICLLFVRPQFLS